MDWLRPFIARFVGAILAGVFTYLAAKYNIVLGENQQAEIISTFVTVILVIFTIFYSIIHKLLSKKINPGDSATTALAVKEKTEQNALDRKGY